MLLALGLGACGSDPAPEVLGPAPNFELIDQRGQPFGSDALDGRLWVANFVFTRCAGICPRLSARMARLQQVLEEEPLRDEVRLVSFSVDPEHDRPEVLAGYAERYRADPERWVFLTGTRDEIWELSRLGFRLAVDEDPGDPDEPLLHSGKFVLVDRAGRIRGYYDALEEPGFESLRADLRRLGAGDG